VLSPLEAGTAANGIAVAFVVLTAFFALSLVRIVSLFGKAIWKKEVKMNKAFLMHSVVSSSLETLWAVGVGVAGSILAGSAHCSFAEPASSPYSPCCYNRGLMRT